MLYVNRLSESSIFAGGVELTKTKQPYPMKTQASPFILLFRAAIPALMAGSLNAALIADENFNYAGSISGQNGGTGWSGAWAGTGVSNLTTSGTGQSLYFGQSPALTSDGSTHVWSESSKGNERDFTTSIPLASQTLYFTALVRAYAGTSSGGASEADLRFGFFDGLGATGNNRANVGITDGTLFAASATDGYGAGGTAAGAFVDDTTYLLAMKRVGGASGAIFASLIEADGNSATLAAEPSSWQVTQAGVSGVTLQSLRFLTNGDGDGGIRIDELRVATDWDSAVAGIVIPEPSSSALLGLGGLLLAARRRRSAISA